MATPLRMMVMTIRCRSGNSAVSCRIGVSRIGQSWLSRVPTTLTVSSTIGITSNEPGTWRRRRTARATSISGEMRTSIGMWSAVNRSAQTGCR